MKAHDMIANPSKYKSTFDYGAAGYIKNLKIDRETGEILKKISCTHLDQNIWLFEYASELTDKMNAEFVTDFGKKAMLLCDIKSALASTKKTPRLKQQKM